MYILFKLPYIQDSVTNEDIIVVTGGEKDGGPEGNLDSVELLFQFNQNYWTSGTASSVQEPCLVAHRKKNKESIFEKKFEKITQQKKKIDPFFIFIDI